MNLHGSQQAPISSALAAAFPANERRPLLRTVEQFSEHNPAFTPAAVRNLVFKAGPRPSSKGEVPGNGLLECGAILRIGRKVLIDEDRFFEWVRQQNEERSSVAASRAAALSSPRHQAAVVTKNRTATMPVKSGRMPR